MTSRRSAASITLVLISSVGLQACGEDVATRDIYRNAADCQRDWGQQTAQCEPVSSGPHAGYYYGPSHTGTSVQRGPTGTTLAPRPGTNAIGSTHVSRGGFGASASSHGASS